MSVSENFMARRLARGISPDRFRGVPELDIVRLETALGTEFPTVYRDYLILMGYEPGGRGKSLDIRFGCLGAINREFLAAFPHVNTHRPNDSFIAIYADQGVDYLCFRTDDARHDPDPPLYRFHPAKGEGIEACASITDYLERLFAGDVIIMD